MVAALVFVDSLSTQCYLKPKCDAKYRKDDSEGYGRLASTIPFGFIRALAYAGTSYPGPSGECYRGLPERWGEKLIEARARFLAAILSPAHWTASGAEDIDTPTSCAIASQAPGNCATNKIKVPVVSIVAEHGIFHPDNGNDDDYTPCGLQIKNAGGGQLDGRTRSAYTRSVEVDDSTHFSLLCDRANATIVAAEIINMVQLVRNDSKTFTKYVNNGKMNYAAARAFCTARGSRLAVLKTNENQQDVQDLNLSKDDDNFWIGANDLSTPGTMTWITGETVSDGITNWASGQPNTLPQRDCVEIIKSSLKWQNSDCSLNRYVLCEEDDY